MSKTFLALLLFLAATTHSYAQSPDLDAFMKEGIKLYDAGDYKGAIEQYEKALKIDSTSASANYEMAYTWFALKEYQKVVSYCDKVINQKSLNVEHSFILKGSALDLLGNSTEAINTYKTGQLVFPGSYLLYYNLALTLYNAGGDKKEIEENLQLALNLNPSHPSSHLLLSYLMINESKRVQAVLCLYNFLLLEPKGNRATDAWKLLDGQLNKGIKKTGEKSTTITLFMDKERDEFSSAEMILSLSQAERNSDENKGKTDNQFFISNTETLFSVLGVEKQDTSKTWWGFYKSFFNDLYHKKMVETFCNYISQSKNDEAINAWLQKNDDKVTELINWSTAYKRK